MKVSYSEEDRRIAVAEYHRVQSVSKAVRNLGYPARHTLYDWLRYGTDRRKPKYTHLLAGNPRYAWQLKLQAVELFQQGYRPKEIQELLDLISYAVFCLKKKISFRLRPYKEFHLLLIQILL